MDFSARREAAKQGRDPTLCDEALGCIMRIAREVHASRYLEIGAGEGYTAIALANETGVEVTALERDPVRCEALRKNAAECAAGPIHILEGDAGEILPLLEGPFDLILLDGPKAQYRRYFPDCKRLLKRGGFLFSDDVLLFGWVRGQAPAKRRMLAAHLREYLALLEGDPDFSTQIYDYGEGFAVSKKL